MRTPHSTALIVSGLPMERFCFEGFLPRRGTERHRRIAAIGDEERTVLIHESPQRLAATLVDLAAACGGDRQVAVARELTKLHEEVWRGTLGEASRGIPTAPCAVKSWWWSAGHRQWLPRSTRISSSPCCSGSSPEDPGCATLRPPSLSGLGVPRRRAYEKALDLKRP